jgi:dihydrodipicolinate synthase/N-acetylneuraminate lyase
MSIFKGLSAFPITPCDEAGQVDTDDLNRLLERLIAAKVASVGLLGSTGTYAYLSRSERLRAIKAAALQPLWALFKGSAACGSFMLSQTTLG